MERNWIMGTETGTEKSEPLWVTVQGTAGNRRAALVIQSESAAGRKILSSGMLWLEGPGITGGTLFRICSCTRARTPGCMFIRAEEAHCRETAMENAVLRELNRILKLEITGTVVLQQSAGMSHGAAS